MSTKKSNAGFSIEVLKNFFCKENLPLIVLCGLAIYAITISLVSIFVLHMPVVPTCAIVILEAVLAVCLSKIPLWIHGLVFIAQIIAGILAGQILFMVFAALVYGIGVCVLFIKANNE